DSRPNNNDVGSFMLVASLLSVVRDSQHGEATSLTHAPTPRSSAKDRQDAWPAAGAGSSAPPAAGSGSGCGEAGWTGRPSPPRPAAGTDRPSVSPWLG